jgi:putative hydrolase of the HAD superfamily
VAGVTDPGLPRAILLDALGTLVALEPPAPRLRAELARRFGIEVGERQAAAAMAAEIGYYRAHLDEGRDRRSLAQLRHGCAEALRAALPQDGAVRALGGDVLTEALLASLTFTPFPDVRPALSTWRAAGVRLVVVSNWDVSLHDVLQRVSLAPLLDAILTSAEAGARKPSPAIFERALGLAGVGREQAVHIGDSLEEDVAGARAAGIRAVLISRDGRMSPPDVQTVASLGEFATQDP